MVVVVVELVELLLTMDLRPSDVQVHVLMRLERRRSLCMTLGSCLRQALAERPLPRLASPQERHNNGDEYDDRDQIGPTHAGTPDGSQSTSV